LPYVFRHDARQTPLNNDLHSKASLPCVKTGAQKKIDTSTLQQKYYKQDWGNEIIRIT
jgi:hypothetical protein